MKKVAILGCGPSGLLAAHAANLNGCHFDVFSKRRKSQLFGSQYLHKPIPGISARSDGRNIEYIVEGSPEEYRRKCHGKAWDGMAAPEEFERHHRGWDIRAAYDKLWTTYSDSVYNLDLSGDISDLDRSINLDNYDLVISTVPRKIWSRREYGAEYVSSNCWALGDAPDLGQKVPFHTKDNTIICEGTKDVGWYRLSKVFGHTTVEWPEEKKPPIHGVALVERPLQYIPGNVTNPADMMLHLGRYGEWKKGVVVTDVFEQALAATRSTVSA